MSGTDHNDAVDILKGLGVHEDANKPLAHCGNANVNAHCVISSILEYTLGLLQCVTTVMSSTENPSVPAVKETGQGVNAPQIDLNHLLAPSISDHFYSGNSAPAARETEWDFNARQLDSNHWPIPSISDHVYSGNSAPAARETEWDLNARHIDLNHLSILLTSDHVRNGNRALAVGETGWDCNTQSMHIPVSQT